MVVDSSAAVEALVGHEEARQALSSTTVLAPHLIDAEVTHAVRGLLLRRAVEPEAADLMMRAWPRLGVVRFAMHPLVRRMWELRANLSAYDATYVALAEELGCPLLTADARLAGAPGVRCDVTVLAA
jgi:predicted nucleic acid-binding protein